MTLCSVKFPRAMTEVEVTVDDEMISGELAEVVTFAKMAEAFTWIDPMDVKLAGAFSVTLYK